MGYRDLKVWQASKELAVLVYQVTVGGYWDRDWGLRDQIRRSVVSVPSNIAEGDARNSQKDSIRFFQIALGSLAEFSTRVEIAKEIGNLEDSESIDLLARSERIENSLGALVKKRKEFL